MKRLLYILFFFPLLFTGCELFDPPEPDEPNSSEEELLPVSFTGEGTFAMRVNGEVWKIGGFMDEIDGSWEPQSGNLRVFGWKGGKNEGADIYVDSVFGPGTYPLLFIGNSTGGAGNAARWYPPGSASSYETDSTHTGTLTLIRADDEYPYVLSGTFEFDAVNEAGEVVQITDGRFDFYYGR